MKGLLSVSFGTSHEETRGKTIDVVEEKLRAEFPDMAFYSAWTSKHIIEKVKAERGEHHNTLDEALEQLTADGVDDLAVASTCLMRGIETRKIDKAVHAWESVSGRSACIAPPLLSASEDRKAVARVIGEEFSSVPDEDALLLMGHGSAHESNKAYGEFLNVLRSFGHKNYYVATVEGQPAFDDVLPVIESSGVTRVHLAPLMFVAGDHAKNDLAGDSPDSWKSRIEACGMQTEVVMRGLGEYEGIHELVCEHVKDALLIREVALRG